MKRFFAGIACVCVLLTVTACATNPMTGKPAIALVNNDELLASAFQQYDEFLSQNVVVEGTPDAEMVKRVGDRIKTAAEKYYKAEGKSSYLKDYQWEYHLVQSDEVNAWCMPGGKIVVYTGILPVTQNEAALATVMGHEVSHALLNHSQQRMSADVLTQIGAAGVSILTSGRSEESQQLAMTVYGAGSQLFGTLPFSRSQESEADHYGLILMAIAGYDPDQAVPFWERMAALGGSTPEFLSTHPSDSTRISQIKKWIPEAEKDAARMK